MAKKQKPKYGTVEYFDARIKSQKRWRLGFAIAYGLIVAFDIAAAIFTGGMWYLLLAFMMGAIGVGIWLLDSNTIASLQRTRDRQVLIDSYVSEYSG